MRGAPDTHNHTQQESRSICRSNSTVAYLNCFQLLLHPLPLCQQPLHQEALAIVRGDDVHRRLLDALKGEICDIVGVNLGQPWDPTGHYCRVYGQTNIHAIEFSTRKHAPFRGCHCQ